MEEMNTVDCIVTYIVVEPFYRKSGTSIGKWCVRVNYEYQGGNDQTTLMFDSEEEALAVTIGYKFQA